MELECLWEYYIRLILRHMKQLKMLRVWKSVSQGLHIYPFNPKSFIAMLSLSAFYSVSSKVRLILDKTAQRFEFFRFGMVLSKLYLKLSMFEDNINISHICL